MQAFDEMDRNRDNLITYEEFRYYIGIIKGQTNQLSVNNFAHSMSADESTRLDVWRNQWYQTA